MQFQEMSLVQQFALIMIVIGWLCGLVGLAFGFLVSRGHDDIYLNRKLPRLLISDWKNHVSPTQYKIISMLAHGGVFLFMLGVLLPILAYFLGW